MKLAALDLSLTSTGWASWQNGDVTFSVIDPGPTRDLARLNLIRNCALKVCEEAELVVIELPTFSSFDGKAQERIGLSFILRMGLWKRGVPFVMVTAPALKKFVVGHGGSPKRKVGKELILKEIFRRFHFDVSDNNIADAIGLLHIGMAISGFYLPEIEPQREVLNALLTKNPWLNKFTAPKET